MLRPAEEINYSRRNHVNDWFICIQEWSVLQMELITKELLINFLLVLFPIFLMQMIYFVTYLYRLEGIKASWLVVFPLISSVLCMLFPFSLADGFNLDLRRIPFLIGILYGGPRYGFWLMAMLLGVRYFIGGPGFFITLLTFAPIAVATMFFSKYYLKMLLRQKLLAGMILTFLSLLLTSLFATQLYEVKMTFSMWSVFYGLNILSILIATILWEVIRINFEVLNKLIKAEKLEIVSNLAASISHEVRNPLTASRGFMQLSYEGDIPQETKEHILISIQELDRATEIINDYLTFAKPAPEEAEKIAPRETVYHVVNVLTPLANMNSVKLDLPLNKKEECCILGERKKLEQALVNIIKNAIESMPGGGKLFIGLQYEAGFVQLKICDQGRGMTPKQVERLGEPYFTTKENGTGLGMMVSFSIIQSIGGKISVTSKINKGTCFLMEFPAAPK